MNAEDLLTKVRATIAKPPLDHERFYWGIALHPDEARLLPPLEFTGPKAWEKSIGMIDGVEIIPSETVSANELRLFRRRKDGAEL